MKMYNVDTNKIIKCGLLTYCDHAFIVTANIFGTTFFLVNYPAQWLSYFYMFQAIVPAITFLTLNKYIKNNRNKNTSIFILVLLWMLTLAAGILVIWKLPDEIFHWLPFAICVFLDTAYRISKIINSNTISAALTFGQFKQYITLFNLVRSFAGISFGIIIFFTATHLGTQWIFIELVGLLTAIALLTYGLPHITSPAKKQEIKKKTFSNTHFVMMAIFMCCIGYISMPADYVFKYSLAHTFNQAHMSAFLGLFTTCTDVLWLFLAGFVSKPVLYNFGLKGSLAILPIGYAIASLIVLMDMNVVTTTLLCAVVWSCTNCFHNMGYELGMNVLMQSIRERGKIYIRLLLFAASLASGLVIWILNYLHFQPQFSLWIGFIICFFALFILKKISANYLKELAKAVTYKRYSPPLLALSEHDEHLMGRLFTFNIVKEDVEILEFALNVLPKTLSAVPKQLLNFLHSENRQVRLLMAQYIMSKEFKNSEQDVYEQLKHDKDPEVIGYLFQKMAQLNPKKGLPLALEYAETSDPRILSGVLPILIDEGDSEVITASSKKLNLLIESSEINDRICACHVISLLRTGDFYQMLKRLLQDDSPEVIAEALPAVFEKKELALLPEITALLLDPNSTRIAAKVLIKFGEISIGYVQPLLHQGTWQKEAIAIEVIAGINSQKAQEIFLEFYDSTNELLKLYAVKRLAYFTIRGQVKVPVKKEAFKRVLSEFSLMENLEKAYQAYDQPIVRHEIDLRMQLTLKRCLYWIGAYSSNSRVMELLPSFISKEKSNVTEHNWAIAEELLENVIDNKKIKKKLRTLHHILNYTLTSGKKSIVPTFEDPWLNYVIENRNKINGNKLLDAPYGKALDLRKSKLFRNVQAEIVLHCIEIGIILEFEKGTFVFKQGDLPDGFYFVLAGQINIILEPQGIVLSSLNKYDFFGELGLLSNSVRTSSAINMTHSTLLYFSKDTFNQLIVDIPDLVRIYIQIMIKYLRRNMEINLT